MAGEGNFDGWVEKSLAISPREARALLRFNQEPEVRQADVSPATGWSRPIKHGNTPFGGHRVSICCGRPRAAPSGSLHPRAWAPSRGQYDLSSIS